MGVESAADRLMFLNEAEHGTVAVYHSAAGGQSDIKGIFDKEFIEVDLGTQNAVSGNHPMFLCREADLLNSGTFDEILVINFITYKIKVIRPDGTGMTTLLLEEQ